MATKENKRKSDEIPSMPMLDPRYNYRENKHIISSKYRSTLNVNKVLEISRYYAENEFRIVKDKKSGALVQEIPVPRIKELMGKKSGSFYDTLDGVAAKLPGLTMGWSDPENHTFDYLAMITRASCDGGIFRIEYNSHLEEYLVGFKKPYATLNLPIALQLEESVYSFKLYRLLKQDCYFKKGQPIDPEHTFCIKYNLNELKMILGIIDVADEKIKIYMNKMSEPDYDYAASLAPKQLYKVWKDFKTNVLDKAVKEINAKTDLWVEYETETGGRGGKVRGINFFVNYKPTVENQPVPEEVDMLSFIEEMEDIIDYNLKTKDLRSIAEAAGYDIEKIRKAHEFVCEYRKSKNITNVTGLYISSIQNSYEEVKAEATGEKNSSKNKFNNFEQRRYSSRFYDLLETRTKRELTPEEQEEFERERSSFIHV